MTKLTDLCDIQYGYAFDSGAFTDDESYPQLVRIRDVKRGYSETYYNGEYPEEYVLSAGDLLIGMDGEFNIARWKVDGALLNQRVCKIIAKDNVDEEFLRFALSKALKAIEDRTSFATVKHLSAKELNKLEIPVPPYEEQEKISEILHRLEKVIDIRQNELASLDELIKARFVELTNKWNASELPLSDVLDDITYGFTNPMPDSDVGPWKITAKDVVNGHVNFETARKTTQEAYDLLTAKSKPIIGDVLLTKDGTLGRTAIVEDEKLCVNQSVAVLRCNNKVLPRFLTLLLQLPEYQAEMTKNSGGGTIKHIYITKVDKMLVKIPDIIAQKEFISFVEQVDKSKVAVQKALDEAQLLFDSLMQEYFG